MAHDAPLARHLVVAPGGDNPDQKKCDGTPSKCYVAEKDTSRHSSPLQHIRRFVVSRNGLRRPGLAAREILLTTVWSRYHVRSVNSVFTSVVNSSLRLSKPLIVMELLSWPFYVRQRRCFCRSDI